MKPSPGYFSFGVAAGCAVACCYWRTLIWSFVVVIIENAMHPPGGWYPHHRLRHRTRQLLVAFYLKQNSSMMHLYYFFISIIFGLPRSVAIAIAPTLCLIHSGRPRG